MASSPSLIPRLQENFPLAPMTTFGIGGPAEFYAEIHGREELMKACRWAKETGLKITVLGFGSNVLISDKGIRGLVISLAGHFKDLRLEAAGMYYAGAAARLPKLVTDLAERGFEGMEALVGVPGTVGGGIFMNAGTRNGEIRDCLKSVQVFSLERLDFQEILTLREDFGYRTSPFQAGGSVICSAYFKYQRAEDKKTAAAKIKRLMDRRKETQPVDTKNVGSIFRNPSGDFAARLIESSGLKGDRVGGAVVSLKHANFIINDSRATAQNVFVLIKRIQAAVVKNTGVHLETELRFLGDFD